MKARFEEDPEEVRLNATMNAFYPRLLALEFTKQDVAAAYQTAMEQAVSAGLVPHWALLATNYAGSL